MRAALDKLLDEERYGFVFVLLPSEDTHGHHKAAAILTLEAAAVLPADRRPVLFGVEAASSREGVRGFRELAGFPVTLTGADVREFRRSQPFGYHDALNYQIIANWVIAAHKSQGLFQMDASRHDVERFWRFEVSGAGSEQAANKLFEQRGGDSYVAAAVGEDRPMNSQTAIPLDPVWQSTRAVTRFAWNSSNADGYTIAEFDAPRGEPIVGDQAGLQSAAPLKSLDSRQLATSGGATVTSYPLRADEHFSGVLVFTFCGSTITTPGLVVLDRLASAIQTVYRLPRFTARLISKIGSLEVELAAIKISERTLGLLVDPAPASESVDTVVRHVEAVMEKRPAGAVLERLLPDLEQLVDERKLIVKAKAFLRERDGILEEEAYLRLRNWSRARHKRLQSVALELIAAK